MWLYLLDEIRKEININHGIYRDDAFGVTDLPPQGADRLMKKIAAIFKKHKLDITIEANKNRVEFLDIYMDLQKEEY